MHDDQKHVYFKAKPELMGFYQEIQSARALFSKAANDLAVSVGGKAAVNDGHRMAGVYFPNGAPEGWKHIQGTQKHEKFFEPKISHSKEMRELSEKMRGIKRPTWKDLLKKIDLDGYCFLGKPAPGQRGITMLYASGEIIGDVLIIKVPVSEGKADNSDLRESGYKGYDLLIPITKAKYLQMLADAEREKEAADA